MRVRKWSTLKAWGLRIVRRSSMMNAVVAVARKLAVILHRLWLDDRDFEDASAAVIAHRHLKGAAAM